MNHKDDLEIPKDLDTIGKLAYKLIYKYLSDKHWTNTGGCKAFYSPKEWRKRGEKYGIDDEVKLVIVYDGGDLYDVFSYNAEYHIFKDEMTEILSKSGLFFEDCTNWYGVVREK